MLRKASFITAILTLLAATSGPAWAEDGAPSIIGVPPYAGELSCEAAGPIGMRMTNIGTQVIVAGAKVEWALIGSPESGMVVLQDDLAAGAAQVFDNGRADGAFGTFPCKAKVRLR